MAYSKSLGRAPAKPFQGHIFVKICKPGMVIHPFSRILLFKSYTLEFADETSACDY